MKNIHIIPTHKQSKLGYISELNRYHIFTNREDPNEIGDNLAYYRNIYITNDEKPKEGDFAYHKIFGIGKIVSVDKKECFVTIPKRLKGLTYNPWRRNIPDIQKIILTTDQDLIKDGVQAINDEVLEWFVNNPNCDEVETLKFANSVTSYVYKIIIPKEESKQETLEEAAEDNVKNSVGLHYFGNENSLENLSRKHYFKEGAKWQQERSYNEEEVYSLMDEYQLWLVNTNTLVGTFKEWFKQFKKK